jgi:hypothetical protein
MSQLPQDQTSCRMTISVTRRREQASGGLLSRHPHSDPYRLCTDSLVRAMPPLPHVDSDATLTNVDGTDTTASSNSGSSGNVSARRAYTSALDSDIISQESPEKDPSSDGPSEPQKACRQTKFNGNFVKSKTGWWKRQMLVDRSLRTMSALTSVFAIIMWIVVFACLKSFSHRTNKNSTSVYQKPDRCEKVNYEITVRLRMSNTRSYLTILSLGLPPFNQHCRHYDPGHVKYVSATSHCP